MRSNELRIGNLVFWDEPNTGDIEISRIDSQDFKLIEIYESDYNPIPLTPEILEKAGFIWKDRTKHWFRTFTREGDDPNDMTLFIGKEEPFYWWGLQNKIFDTIAVQSIYYLHQLQNLYFVLTGEELPIEL